MIFYMSTSLDVELHQGSFLVLGWQVLLAAGGTSASGTTDDAGSQDASI